MSTIIDVPDPPQAGFWYGAYADLRVGSKNIKVGPRFDVGETAYWNYRQPAWRLTPLLLRVYH